MKYILTILLLLASSLQSVFANPQKVADQFIEYWNSGESRALTDSEVFTIDFINRRGKKGIATIMKMVYLDNGSISLHELSKAANKKTVFTVSSQNGNWLEVNLDYVDDLKISGMSFIIVPKPADQGDKGLTSKQIVTFLEEYLNELVVKDAFGGSVILAKNGKPLFAKAYGMADRSKNRNNTLDTPINLGSMNKMFTGLAITQLVAQGRLAFEDTVGKWFPDYSNQKIRNESQFTNY